MTIKEQLRSAFPKTVNKSGIVYTSLVANDNGSAAIEKELTNLSNYMRKWKSTKNLYETSGTQMQYIADFISYLDQFKDESDTAYLKRLNAIFVRGKDTVWGTPYNVVHTFRNYFNTDNIWLVENTNDKAQNLIRNFVFDDLDGWVADNCQLSEAARFIKSNGVEMSNNGTLSVTIDTTDLIDKPCYFHIFYKGKIKATVSGAEKQEWDWRTSSYVFSPIDKNFENTEWKNAEVFLLPRESEITIQIKSLEDGTYVDYPRLFQKRKNPSFTIMIQFTGETAKNALTLAGGRDDPDESISHYDNAGYYDQDFLTGVNSGYALDLYQELLSYVKAVGVKAYLEIVNRDVDK